MPIAFRCKGCFNPETWDYEGGQEFTQETRNIIIELLDQSYIDHLSILGGEPLEPDNLFVLYHFLEQVKYSFPDKKIWLWTGYTWEQLQEKMYLNMLASSFVEHMRGYYLEYILESVDFLIDGPFIQKEKDLTLLWRGSRNQRIIKSAESMKARKLILAE